MTSNCYVIGICGGTCSGKTTLAKNLHDELNGLSIYLSQDSYYKDQSHKSSEEIKLHNFDHPESLDLDLLHNHILQLKKHNEIHAPNYCFKTHSRLAEVHVIQPANVVIVEGILIFSHKGLRDLFDLRVFVDVEADVRLIRRINRDCLERGRSINSITEQYLKSVKPMHEKFVDNNKHHSDLVINSDTFNKHQGNLKKLLLNKIIDDN